MSRSKRKNHSTTSHSARGSASSSTKNYYCRACKIDFVGRYNSPKDFIRRHMKASMHCRQSIIECTVCHKEYYDDHHFHSHLTKTNMACRHYHNNIAISKQKAESYATTQAKKSQKEPNSTMEENSNQTLQSSTEMYNLTHNEVTKLTMDDLKKRSGQKQSSPKKRKVYSSPTKQTAEKGAFSNDTLDDVELDNESADEIFLEEDESFVFGNSDPDDEECVDQDVPAAANNNHVFNNTDRSTTNANSASITATTSGTVVTNNHSSGRNIFQAPSSTTSVDENNTSCQKEGDCIIDNLLNISDRSGPPQQQRNCVNINHNNDTTNNTPEEADRPQTSNDPTNNLFDENLLLYIKSLRDKETPSSSLCTNDSALYHDGLILVKYLISKNISLSCYDDLMKWKHRDNKLHSYISLKKLQKYAEAKVYGPSFQKLIEPKKEVIKCPSGRKVTMITSDVSAAIVDLLSDLNLTDLHNTNLLQNNEENPFDRHISNNYTDIHQGQIYISTSNKVVTDTTKQHHVGFVLAMDEATLDSYSKLSFHPVNMTLTLYNRAARNLSMSWRTIGYIPNFNQQLGGSKKYTPDEKLNDFHFSINHILTNLRYMMTGNGMKWKFTFSKYPGRVYERSLIFTLSYIISDAKEHDMLCGRMSSRSSTKRLCRDCDILTSQSDDPTVKCKFLNMYDIITMNQDQLKDISFKMISPFNAFRYMNFGANIYGINGATPAEPLHQILGGVVERLPTSFLIRLTVAQTKILDSHVAYLSIHFSRQSDRDIYNLKLFKNGISDVSKLTGKEKLSRVIAIYLTLLSSDFENMVRGKLGRKPAEEGAVATIITQQEYNNWLKVFEETVIFASWAHLEEHPKAVFNGGRKSVVAERLRDYMEFYKTAANRNEGMGLKILKFHQITHLWWIIRMYGSLLNIDSGRSESSHRYKKQIASHTQKRVDSFQDQTAMKEYSYHVLMKAINKANIDLPSCFEMISQKANSNNERQDQQEQQNIKQSYGSKFVLTFDYVQKEVTAKWLSYAMRDKPVNCPQDILDVVFQKYQGYNNGIVGQRIVTLECFTELVVGGNEDNNSESTLFRACPSYRQNGHWFDWAIIDWGEDGMLEGRLLIFMNFANASYSQYNGYTNIHGMNQPHAKLPHERMVAVHSTTAGPKVYERLPSNQPRNGNEHGTLVNRLAYFKMMENVYNFISIENISQPCAVFVDKATQGHSLHDIGHAERVIVLSSMREWHLKFVDYSSEDLLEEASQRVDDDYPEENERHIFEG